MSLHTHFHMGAIMSSDLTQTSALDDGARCIIHLTSLPSGRPDNPCVKVSTFHQELICPNHPVRC